MEIIVGRKGQQPFTITDQSVSGRHLKLTTLDDGRVQVEDLGSTNGTFINDLRIVRKIVSRDTVVRMGTTYTFCIKDVIPVVGQGSRNPEPVRDPEMLRKFAELEQVWEKYQSDKIALQRSNVVKGFLRMLPTFILGCMGFLLSCIPSLADYRVVITLGGLALGGVFTWVAFRSAAKMPEQMEKLNEQFQIDYVCPKCGTFLGFTPFKNLKNKGRCNSCRTQLV